MRDYHTGGATRADGDGLRRRNQHGHGGRHGQARMPRREGPKPVEGTRRRLSSAGHTGLLGSRAMFPHPE